MDHQKAREFQKNIYFCFIDYTKAFTIWITTNWKICQEMGTPDHLNCLLRNLYAGQEAKVSTGHRKTHWFQIGKGACQGCVFSSCLFNFYEEYIMQNAWLNETQTGTKIAGRNINNLGYADYTTLMAESKEKLKSLWIKVKQESEKAGLKLNIQKMKSMTSGLITSWQIDRETVTDIILLDFKIIADGDSKCLLLGRKAMTNIDNILKSRDITYLTTDHIIKTMVFPVSMCGHEIWTIKKAEH